MGNPQHPGASPVPQYSHMSPTELQSPVIQPGALCPTHVSLGAGVTC